MKMTRTLTMALALGAVISAQAQDIKINVPGSTPAPATPAAAAPAAAAPAAPAQTFTNDQLLEEFGWFIGKRVGLTDLDFSKAESDALLKGLAAAIGGKDSPYALEKVGPAMDDFMQKKQQAYLGKLKQQGLAASAAFFTKLKENKNVVELPSGLRYEIVKQGEGANAKSTDTVKVHYKGQLLDGTVFDSSIERGEPAEFPLDGGLIDGWKEGLTKINKGGKIKLYVPPSLAYGDQGNQGIPPSSTLIFEVEVLDIKPTPGPANIPVAPGK